MYSFEFIECFTLFLVPGIDGFEAILNLQEMLIFLVAGNSKLPC